MDEEEPSLMRYITLNMIVKIEAMKNNTGMTTCGS